MALAVSNNLDLKLSLAQSITQKRIDQAIERLSTGKRINSAKDDVGSLVQVSRLESEIISFNSFNRTAKNAQNILNIADDAAASVQSGLLRLRELAVQSANGTLSANDLVAINEETDQILTSIDQTSNSTNLGGLKLLDGTFTNKDFRLTNSVNGVISLSFESLSHEALGLKNLDLSVHAGKSEIIGTSGADTITGKANIDKITSGAGNDQINGRGGNDVSIFNEAYTNFDIFTGAFTTLNVMGNHSQNVEIGFEIINTDGTIYRVSYSPSNTATQDVAQQLANASIKDIGGNSVSNPGFTLSRGADASIYIRKDDGSDFSIRPWGGVNQGAVNTVSGSSTSNHFDVASNSNGKSAVAWSTVVSGGSSESILMQRYDASGNENGSTVNVRTGSSLQKPSLTYLENDYIALTHVELNSVSNSKDTYLHIIDDYGFVVHTSKVNKNLSTGDYFNPYVTDLGNSEFMVQWTYAQNAGSSQTNGSFAQIYDYNGLKKGQQLVISDDNTGSGAAGKAVKISNSKFVLPTFKNSSELEFEIFNKYEREQVLIGKEFQLNTTATGDQYNAKIASWSDNQRLNHGHSEFISVWQSDTKDIIAQRFDGLGNMIGDEIVVSTNTTGQSYAPNVTALAASDFLVSWIYDAQDGTGPKLMGSRYNMQSKTITATPTKEAEFTISTNVAPHADLSISNLGETGHSVKSLSSTGSNDSGFIVSWHGEANSTSGNNVVTQIFDGNNNKTLMPEGNEIIVNSHMNGDQTNSDIVELSNGNFVVTWHSLSQNGYRSEARAQIFTRIGERVGSEFKIDPDSGANDFAAWYTSIAKTNDGGFVVTWESDGQDGSSAGIFLQKFDQTGSKVGNAQQVNTYASGNQFDPSISLLSDGGHIVTWSSYRTPAAHPGKNNSSDVSIIANNPSATHDYFIRFTNDTTNSNGNSKIEILGHEYDIPSGTIASKTQALKDSLLSAGISSNITNVGDSFGTYLEIDSSTIADYVEAYGTSKFNLFGDPLNNTDGLSSDSTTPLIVGASEAVSNSNPSGYFDVAYNASGERAVSWSSTPPSGGSGSILLQRYNADGSSNGNLINLDNSGQIQRPSVTFLENGSTAVTFFKYKSGRYDTELKIIDQNGTVTHSSVANSGEATGDYVNPEVIDLGNSKFLVQWNYSTNHPQQPSTGSKAQVFNYDGSKSGNSFSISKTSSGSGASNKAIALDNSNFAILVHDTDNGSNNIDLRVYDGLNGSKTSDFSITTNANHNSYAPVFAKTNAGILVVWAEGNSKDLYAQHFSQNGTALSSKTSIASDVNDVNVIVSTDEYGNEVFNILWGSSSDSNTYLKRLDSAMQTVYTSDTEVFSGKNYYLKSALDSSGNVLVFENSSTNAPLTFKKISDKPALISGYDRHNDIFAQLYDVSGNKSGTQFRINTAIDGIQDPSAVIGLSGGGFAVTWQSEKEDGDSNSITAQIYGSNGNKSGNPIQVNTTTSGAQKNPDITQLQNGNIVISWQDSAADGSGTGVFAQVFQTDGTKVGSEFQINSTTANNQANSKVLALSSGNFLAVWDSEGGQDGSGKGIYGQFFAANGTKQNSEFVINKYTAGNQNLASVAELDNGNIVVSWDSEGPDGSAKGISAQIINSSGERLGLEKQANEDSSYSQQYSSTVTFSDDSYVVAWRDTGSANKDIKAQFFNSSGAKVGTEIIVATPSTSSANNFHLDMIKLTNNDLVISYSKGTDLFAQILGNDGSKKGSEFKLDNEATQSDGTNSIGDEKVMSSIVSLSSGGFLAVWNNSYPIDVNGNGNGDYLAYNDDDQGILGQFFSADGSVNGSVFQINQYSKGIQNAPHLTELENGNILVSWTASPDNNGLSADGSGKTTFAAILAPSYNVLWGTKDNFNTSDGFSSVNAQTHGAPSTQLITYLNNTYPGYNNGNDTNYITEATDEASTNRIRPATFKLSVDDKHDSVFSALLKIKAKPIDDNKGEGNDTLVLTNVSAVGGQTYEYNVGLGVDGSPNNFFNFDWQIDDRPTINPNGFDIIIDLADFNSKEGTNQNIIDKINSDGFLDVIIEDDTQVDYFELEINGKTYTVDTSRPDNSSVYGYPIASPHIAKSLSSDFSNDSTITKTSQGFLATWIEGTNKNLYGQYFDNDGNDLSGSKQLIASNVNSSSVSVSSDGSGNEYLNVLWGSSETGDTYFRQFNGTSINEVASHKTEVFSNTNENLKSFVDNNGKIQAFETSNSSSSINYRSLDQVAMDKNTRFGIDGRIFDGYSELLETKSVVGNINGQKDTVVVGKQHGDGSYSNSELYGIDRHKNVEWLKFSDGYYDTVNETFHANPFEPDLGEIPEPIPAIDAAIKKVSQFLGKNGASYRAIESIISQNINYSIKIEKSVGLIRDTDMAQESLQFAKENLLLSTQANLVKAINVNRKTVLSLLREDSLLYKQAFLY